MLVPRSFDPFLSKTNNSSGNQIKLLNRYKNYMDVSKNNGTPKSSILIGFSTINHPFWGFSHYFWKHPYTFHEVMAGFVFFLLTCFS